MGVTDWIKDQRRKSELKRMASNIVRENSPGYKEGKEAEEQAYSETLRKLRIEQGRQRGIARANSMIVQKGSSKRSMSFAGLGSVLAGEKPIVGGMYFRKNAFGVEGFSSKKTKRRDPFDFDFGMYESRRKRK